MAEPPASLITLQPVLHPLDPGYREALCVAQQENKAAPVLWNWEWHARPSLLALLTPGTKKDTPKTPALGDWSDIDSHSTQAAQHQPFPARFFSALWNILDCFLLLPGTLSATC